MKKNLFVIIGIFLIIVATLGGFYYNYQQGLMKVMQINEEYEYYLKNEISGSSLMTLINKVIDQNEKNEIEKDSEKRYIENDENSIRIQIKFLEAKKTFDMEAINGLGSEAFVKNYNSMAFKCTDVKYHEKTGQIKYMLFEQI